MKPFLQDETLSPWQTQNEPTYQQCLTDFGKHSRKATYTASQSSSRYKSVSVLNRKQEKPKILEAPRIKVESLRKWSSASLVRKEQNQTKERVSSTHLKNQLQKYTISQEQPTAKEENENRMNFSAPNFTNNQNCYTFRRQVQTSSANRNKKRTKLQLRGIKIQDKNQKKGSIEQETDLPVKIGMIVKQVSSKDWSSVETMRLNLNRFMNNYMKDELKLIPLCIKLKLNK